MSSRPKLRPRSLTWLVAASVVLSSGCTETHRPNVGPTVDGISDAAIDTPLADATLVDLSGDSAKELPPVNEVTDSGGDGPDGKDITVPDATDADTGTSGPPPVSSGVTRRLSIVELSNALERLTGVIPETLSRLPPDSLGHSFDRVVNAQSMSRAHLDAYFDIATEVANTLIGDKLLDELTPECSDEILPPLQDGVVSTVIGASLGLEPEWAVQPATDPSHLGILYAPSPTASYSHTFPAAGTYTVTLDLDVTNGPIDYTDVLVGGVLAHTEGASNGPSLISFEVTVPEGPALLQWQFVTEPEFHNLAITFREIVVTGPVDPGAVTNAAARAACADAVIDHLAPRAFRRPITTIERDRLTSLYAAGTGAAALRMVLQGILANPLFLYVVEVGTPVPGAPGTFTLDQWEVATRLSLALCEEPPDEILRTAASAGDLQTPAQIEAQARRILALPCARATVLRFYRYWLHLNHLDTLNKSPEEFPVWSDDVRDGLVAESSQFIEELFFNEEADLPHLFMADYAWPDSRSAALTGTVASTGPSVPMPPERRGILTSAAVMAVTAPFDGTSPVERGVFVAAQLLCDPLPPPPEALMVAPPVPDKSLTTKERWAQHSSNEACFGCHQFIDPIGFALEGFDGVGQFRTTENGLPVVTTGGLPQVGVADGELDGGAELSGALATSPELAACFAKQYLRFALGRLEGDADVAATAAVAAVLGNDSMFEGVVALFTTPGFVTRYEVQEDAQ